MSAPTILTQQELNALGQRLLALVPNGSEYFKYTHKGYVVDVDACMRVIEQRKHDALKWARRFRALQNFISERYTYDEITQIIVTICKENLDV